MCESYFFVFLLQVDVSYHFLEINLLESRDQKRVCLFKWNSKLQLTCFDQMDMSIYAERATDSCRVLKYELKPVRLICLRDKNDKLFCTLSSSQPLLLFLVTTSLHVLCAHKLCFVRFQHCCPYGTCTRLTFALVHHTYSVVFWRPTVSSKPSVRPSGSHKCPRFSIWLTLCTIADLLTCLRTC